MPFVFATPYISNSRPYKSGNENDAWPYSAAMRLPHKEYPLSIQVLWLFDNFTSSNGAFYYIPKGFDNHDGGREYPKFEEGIYPGEFRTMTDDSFDTNPENSPQLVTGMAGSVIFAHGSA